MIWWVHRIIHNTIPGEELNFDCKNNFFLLNFLKLLFVENFCVFCKKKFVFRLPALFVTWMGDNQFLAATNVWLIRVKTLEFNSQLIFLFRLFSKLCERYADYSRNKCVSEPRKTETIFTRDAQMNGIFFCVYRHWWEKFMFFFLHFYWKIVKVWRNLKCVL
jgi:hypothetical protein